MQENEQNIETIETIHFNVFLTNLKVCRMTEHCMKAEKAIANGLYRYLPFISTENSDIFNGHACVI